MSEHDTNIEVRVEPEVRELLDKVREWQSDIREMLEEDKRHES